MPHLLERWSVRQGVMVALLAAAGATADGRLRLAAQAASSAIPLQPAPGIPGVIAAGTRPELIATGLMGADDPIWVPDLGLVFSEPNANRVVRLTAASALETLVGDLHLPLGMTADSSGRLISIQSEQGFVGIRVVWPRGQEAMLADRFEGLPFNRPNGITVNRAGGLYFTDPGLNPAQEAELRKIQARLPPAVYYVPRGGAPIRVAEGIARPNGIHLSRDEKTLYVNDTNGTQSFAFDVQADGRLANRRVFATHVGRTAPLGGGDGVASGADDLVIDGAGRVYSVTAAGIEVFDDRGRPLGVLPVFCTPAGARCQALAFGGPEKRPLFVAGSGTLLRVPMLAQGFTGRAK